MRIAAPVRMRSQIVPSNITVGGLVPSVKYQSPAPLSELDRRRTMQSTATSTWSGSAKQPAKTASPRWHPRTGGR